MNKNRISIRLLTVFFEEKPGPLSLLVVLALTFIAVLYWVIATTPSACYGSGDCVKYSEMAKQFISRDFKSIDYPFNLRVMAPWLASFSAQNVTDGFIWINAISAIFFVFMCFGIARKLEFRNAEFFILILWFFLHPLGFRFYTAIPASVDPLSYALLGLVTLLFLSEMRIALWVAISFALLAKESFIFIAAIIFVAELLYIALTRDKRSVIALASAFGAVVTIILYRYVKEFFLTNYFNQSQEWEITTISTITWWANEAWKEPERLLVWIGAFFCSAGLFPVFLSKNIFAVKNPTEARVVAFFFLGAIGYFALGLLAGSDMSRIIFNGNLLIISIMLISSKRNNVPLLYLAITFGFSAVFALLYTYFFPAPFEYDYFMHEKRITPTAYYVLVNLLAILGLRNFFLKKQRGIVSEFNSLKGFK